MTYHDIQDVPLKLQVSVLTVKPEEKKLEYCLRNIPRGNIFQISPKAFPQSVRLWFPRGARTFIPRDHNGKILENPQ